jgi:hypothetical protein
MVEVPAAQAAPEGPSSEGVRPDEVGAGAKEALPGSPEAGQPAAKALPDPDKAGWVLEGSPRPTARGWDAEPIPGTLAVVPSRVLWAVPILEGRAVPSPGDREVPSLAVLADPIRAARVWPRDSEVRPT